MLADDILRSMKRPTWRKMGSRWITDAVERAHRFVLTDEMSSMLGHLSYAARPRGDDDRYTAMLEGSRSLSRAPFATTWVEMNFRERYAAAFEYRRMGDEISPLDYDPPADQKIGWLIMRHPVIETAFMCVNCTSHTLMRESKKGRGASYDARTGEMHGMEPNAEPNLMAYAWRTDSGELPWRRVEFDGPVEFMRNNTGERMNIECSVSGVIAGHMQYSRREVGIVETPLVRNRSREFRQRALRHLASTTARELCYVWTFLSTINDVPTVVTRSRAQTGGLPSYRRQLEHSVIHLKVPQRTSVVTLARRVARAARRKAHMVRGHWRVYHKNTTEQYRKWIGEYKRGDETLGWVTHDYSVETANQKEKA